MVNFKQSGVALITVMLILALATVTAVSMVSRQNIDIHRSANIFDYEQAYQYVEGAESFAKRVLEWDLANSPNNTDSLGEEWNTPVTTPIEGGGLKGEIEDLQACFNLNTLVLNGQVQTFQRTRFRRLLFNLHLNQSLSEPVIDWIDADQSESGSFGAEDNEYLNYATAYRTANRYMSDVSELLLIKDIDYKKVYEILSPHVCVIENDTDININTANATVISSIVAGVSIQNAEKLVKDRELEEFATLNDFFKHAIFAGKTIAATDRQGLSVSSDYFRLTSSVQVGKIQVQFTTLLNRRANGVSVIKRSRSVL